MTLLDYSIVDRFEDPKNRRIVYNLAVKVAIYHGDAFAGLNKAEDLIHLLLPTNHRRMDSFPVTFAE